MKFNTLCKLILILLLPILSATAYADGYAVDYETSMTVGAGSGGFAPYYISSLRHGRFTQADNVQAEARLWRGMEREKHFSYGFGVDIIGGYSSKVDYERYNSADKSWLSHGERPSSFWLQQLYGELKYRSVFVEAGMKEQQSAILNQSLTSGDLIESGNTRPMPQLRVGFIDFQDVPFTRGWIQIGGEVAFGRMIDDGWWRSHYNYCSWHITTNQWYNYKRCYFRTMPSKPFSVTFGMQAAAQFGGNSEYYYFGENTITQKNELNLKTFLKMIIPFEDGGEDFYTGNHIGSWDIRARYRLKNGDELFAYCSWLWEDGSGIGKLNGWDGLWGLEYKSGTRGIVSGAVLEYMDFTNQSGPIHLAPDDFPGTTLPGHVSGADDYYNNATYNSYAYFGQSIGTPAMMAPIYNTDGYPAYIANAMRGFHIGIEGSVTPRLDYRLKGGYRKAWGTSKVMLTHPIHLTALMFETKWRPAGIKGLTVNASMELNRGTMPGNSFGAMLGVSYSGLLNF